MKFTVQSLPLKSVPADSVVLFLPQEKSALQKGLTLPRKLLGKRLDTIIALERFLGKEAEVLSIFSDGKLKAPRLYLAGLGEGDTVPLLERYRRAGAAVARLAANAKVKRLALVLPGIDGVSGVTISSIASAMAEGVYLASYRFDKYLTEKKNEGHKISELVFLVEHETFLREIKKTLRDAQIICEATVFARDLANAPSNEIYPETLASRVRQSAEKYGYRTVVWEKGRIEQTGFGGLLAVSAGSTRAPRFIIMEHNAGQPSLATIVLIGKGVTFDSGGISIKPSAGMGEMKMDMSGAAAVIGAMEAAARLDLPVHLVGLIPATENLPSGSSMKPGDIITHYGGKTSEVDNTDAEGRLILADALAYASIFKPDAVIDLATLTGACVVALGQHASGMMGNNDELMAQVKLAGDRTFERVWQLPIFPEYESQIKSDVADVKNVGGKWAGAITAALFLKKFIGNYKWVHLDIAGTAMLEETLPYAGKGGSGVGVRLLIDFLKNWKR